MRFAPPQDPVDYEKAVFKSPLRAANRQSGTNEVRGEDQQVVIANFHIAKASWTCGVAGLGVEHPYAPAGKFLRLPVKMIDQISNIHRSFVQDESLCIAYRQKAEVEFDFDLLG